MASKSSPSRPKGSQSIPSTSELSGLDDAAGFFRPAVAAARPDQLGHRERLRERFLEGGADALPDYEMVELGLFAAIQRREVKPLAKKLIETFGSFAEAIAAPRARLLEVDGIGESVVTQLKIVEAAALRLAKGKVLNRPALSSWNALLDYCTAAMGRSPHEEFR